MTPSRTRTTTRTKTIRRDGLPLERSEIMRRVKSRDTTPETRLRKALFARGLRYGLCDASLPGKPDIVLARQRLAIFIDGDYWHGNQWRRRGLARLEDQFQETANRDYWLRKIRRNMERDRRHTAALLDKGWRVLRLWESDVMANLQGCAGKIARCTGANPDERPSSVGAVLSRRTVAEFFAGIGLTRMALENEGWRVVFANDIDKKKRGIYKKNFAEEETDAVFRLEDIHNLKPGDIPTVALATASFPCTDLSLAGERRRLDGKQSGAFWGFARILEGMGERRPPLVLLENVAGFLTSRKGKDFHNAMRALGRMGYWLDAFVLDAAHFTPQSRPRLFTVGMLDRDVDGLPFDEAARANPDLRPPRLIEAMRGIQEARWRLAPLPTPPERATVLADVLEEIEDDSPLWWDTARVEHLRSQMSERHAALAEKMIHARRYSYGTIFRRVRKTGAMAELRVDGLAGCLRTPRGGSSRQILFRAGRGSFRVRLLTPRECARLQGVPDTFRLDGVRANRALFGLGDAVCVPAVQWIARHVLDPAVNSLLRGRLLEGKGAYPR